MPVNTNEEQRVCCCASGSFTKEIMRMQIVGCILRIVYWAFMLTLMSRGMYMADHGIKLVAPGDDRLTPEELVRERRLLIAMVAISSFMILFYVAGIILEVVFFCDVSNKMESVPHLITWHVYAAFSIIFSLVFDLVFILSFRGITIIFLVLTISLNAYTIKAVNIQRERLKWKNVLELSVHLTEENL
ncbi:unnamed protein product [Allacma fusca]|uniref:Uncharacterized protein n=1 Tax=Allacma fusca TaxID=39272 RepID=A0A8J2PBC8_9HEXA|nr:unnamed protein product [Allacma fusca]